VRLEISSNTFTSATDIDSRENLQESFNINVLGVHWTSRAFLPLLQKGTQKKIINM
jgi:NAD(P)-dependent dehydrogenase (short-subunit alcohol dehydrogenase family)